MAERDREVPEDVVDDDDSDDAEVDEIVEELAEHPDAPEADVIEQHRSVVPPERPQVRLRPDVPEADALDQAIPVDDEELAPADDDTDYDG
jgi:hypothetical protein